MVRSKKITEQQKDIILFVGKAHGSAVQAVRVWAKKEGRKIRLGLIADKKTRQKMNLEELKKMFDLVLICDTTSPHDIQKTLLPYSTELLAMTCRGEPSISLFSRIVPHVPYLRAPTSESLVWSSDKLLMRRRMKTFNASITPKYTTVKNISARSLKKIEDVVGFPLMVKPTGLAMSRLVSLCFHKEELTKTLRHVFRHIRSVYKKSGGNWEPKVLVEQFMEGDMYSVDAYVSARGKIWFCPMVHIKTGRVIGFEDFFGYTQITPTSLSPKNQHVGEAVAKDAIHALGLRSTSAHVELMKTEEGWKVIELGARIGGFRHALYEYAYGFNHTVNDILIRMGEKPIISKKGKGYAVAMKFFAKKEGRLTNIYGLKKASDLRSHKTITQNKKIGDRCMFAKHGGSSVFDIILFHREKAQLLADMRRLEKMIDIVIA